MKYILVVFVFSFSVAFTQNSDTKAKSIAKSCYDFLDSQKDIKFDNNSSMQIEYDSIPIMENYTSTVFIGNREKVYLKINNGKKTTILNYDGEELDIVSIEDRFYSTYILKDAKMEGMAEFCEDSLNYQFPLVHLFEKDGHKKIQKLNPEAIYGGLKHINGIQVHHLIFNLPNFSWQMFISADETRPVPIKIVINDRKAKSQYIAELSGWDFSSIDANKFDVRIESFIKIKASN